MKPFLAVVALAIGALSPRPAAADWAQNGIPVAAYPYSQTYVVAVPDGAGGAFLAWEDSRSGVRDIYAQRVGADGTSMWTAGGIPICTAANDQSVPKIAPDGAGGVVIAWEDARNGGLGNADVLIQRVGPNGNTLWFDDGLALCTAGNRQFNIDLYFDGSTFLVAWEDTRNGLPDIYVQRFDTDGVPYMVPDGVAAVLLNASTQSNPVVVSDGAGGAIVAWDDDRNGTPQAHVQAVNFLGSPVWTYNGVSVDPGLTSAGPVMIEDGTSGVYIAWYDDDGDRDIYAEQLDYSGARVWKTDVMEVPGDQEALTMIPDGAGGMVLAWEDHGVDSDIYAQRLNALGVPLWLGVVPVCTESTDQFLPVLASDGDGGAIVAWRDSRNTSADIYAQRVRSTGGVQWASGGVPVSVSYLGGFGINVAGDGNGGAILAWSGGSVDVYAQRLEPNYGAWGQPEPAIASVADDPGDQGGDVVVNWWPSERDSYLYPEVDYYSVWRAIDPAASTGMKTVGLADVTAGLDAPVVRRQSTAAGDYFWELVGTQTALRSSGYSVLAPTRQDSTSTDPAVHYFQVAAHTGDPSVFYVSDAASGYSVDNLAPVAPLLLTAQRVGNYVRLDWQPGGLPEPDFDAYAVYRAAGGPVSPTPLFYLNSTGDETLWDTTASPDAAYYYIVTAVDIHENQSEPSNTASVAGTLTGIGDAPGLTALSVRANVPNPFGGSTELQIGLPAPADVAVEVYDVAGRRVAGVTVPSMGAGWTPVRFDGRDTSGKLLPSGVYFYRVLAGGETVTRKFVIQR